MNLNNLKINSHFFTTILEFVHVLFFVSGCRLYLDGKSQNLDLKCALPHYTERFEKTKEISSGVIILLKLRFWFPIALLTV